MTEPSCNIPETKGGVASAEEGYVILDGPDGIAVTMTAQAAEQTAQSLLNAAEMAGRPAHDRADDERG